MAEVLVFHHAQGLTPGVHDFAGRLRAAGHVVHAPDLYEGRVFADLESGVAHARQVGFDVITRRARAAAAELPADLVYAGFSLGVVPAQELAQTRPGARGALLFHACVPPAEFGGPWPQGVPVQIHGMDRDEFFAGEGDLDAGVAHARQVGFGAIGERARTAAAALPAGLVYAGFSLGVVPAQELAQTRPGARGALLFHACVPPAEFGGPWPQGVPVQIHGMDGDDFFAAEGDLDAARALVAATPEAELFVYPGEAHLFADSSLPAYDAQAAGLLTDRVLGFLGRVS